MTAPTGRFKAQSANKSRHWEWRPRACRDKTRRLSLSYFSFYSGVKTHSGSNCCECLTFRSKLSKGEREVNRMEDEANDDSQREPEGGRMSDEEPQTGGSVK